MKTNTTKEEFQKMLENHDWTFGRSDHNATHNRGEAQRMNINNAKDNDPELKKIYDDYILERFGR